MANTKDRTIFWSKKRKNWEQWAVFDKRTKKIDMFEMSVQDTQPSDIFSDMTKKDFQKILKNLKEVM